MKFYVSDLVSLALRSIGVKSLNDQLRPNATIEALQMLNIIRAGRSIRATRNWQIYDKVYDVVNNTHYITLGTPTSNITTYPTEITSIEVMLGSDGAGNYVNNWPMVIKPFSEYRKVVVQTVFAIPSTAFIDTNYPERKIWFYPGLSSGYSVRVVGKAYFTDYENITDEWVDPPETFNIQRLALAVELAPLYGISDDIVMSLVKQLGSEEKAYAVYLGNQISAPTYNQAAGHPTNGSNSFAFLGGRFI